LIDERSSIIPWSKGLFSEELLNPMAHCFVLDGDGKYSISVLGYICFRILEGESELLTLGVDSDHRRQGFGKRLMSFYIDFCRGKDVKTLYLETRKENLPALLLYQQLAYETIGLRPGYFKGKFDALLMKKSL
jgi:[ribosomal protein S18]-alanine N-acetyltransferase